ncbi:hypothetical protein K503DRAFT_769043 [Rhizopogon vinicolor AM-OR11-026]|uniref:Uncharacterized protein n=1 Tax=Rhizopogon vinicolor AM-OR11-026 TaxID=1314800 RepID=A0A1B7N4Y2_9AGAM|nr:hypothetical protein K503DRAFT_769043 [Rhizopogon vinicolor AM-OR11-026]
MFCLHSRYPCWSSTTSQLCQTDWQNSRELLHQLIPHHPTQTMRFSFFLVIAALTASMSVSACSGYDVACSDDGDCCSGLYCDDLASGQFYCRLRKAINDRRTRC